MSRNTSWVVPAESLTERWRRYHTFEDVSPTSGTVKVPPVCPLVGGMKGCRCSSWWKSTRQVKALAGSVPSSASVPLPLKVRVSPPE